VGLGVSLLDDYLRFVVSRYRPNTVLGAAYDLKVFFTVVGKQPEDVQPVDVLAFVTAQRSGQPSIDGVLQSVSGDAAGVSLRTVRAGCRACLGCMLSCMSAATCRRIRCRAGCRPGENETVLIRGCRWSARPARCRAS
jgi:hypothetical protein